MPETEIRRLKTFGTTVEGKCSYDLKNLVDKNLLPKYANIFFDMYLVDYDGTLVDVPVKITNAKSYSGQKVNSFDNMDNWILSRRFFLFDTLSGVDTEEEDLIVVRYAKQITLKISLDTDELERIYPPYLEITYEEKPVDSINTAVSERFKEVEFYSEYIMDTSGFWKGVKTFFLTLMVVIGLITIVKSYIFISATRLSIDSTASGF